MGLVNDVTDGQRRVADRSPGLRTGGLGGRPINEKEREWLATNVDFKPLMSRGLRPESFDPWEVGRASVEQLVQINPTIDKIGAETALVQKYMIEARKKPLGRVILLEEESGELFVLVGRHRLKAYKDVYGQNHEIEYVKGINRSKYSVRELYLMREVYVVNEILSRLETRMKRFAKNLDEGWGAEFGGLESVLSTYVHFDIRNGKADYTLINPLITSIMREMERLIDIDFPFTQELCGGLAQGYEKIGTIYDDLNLIFTDEGERNLALLAYELANVWYRAAQYVYTGIFPVKAQLRIVNNMIRLGTLTKHRPIFRRAIRELCILLDTDRFTDDYLALVSQRGRGEPLSRAEEEDLVCGFLDTRRRFRADVRDAMAEAITQFHLAIPDSTKRAFKSLEKDILSGREKGGPSALLHFLRANLTVLSELEYVEGGSDFLIGEPDENRYMNMLEHVEEVTKALEALETAARGLRKIAEAREKADSGQMNESQAFAKEGAALVEEGTGYFFGRLLQKDRQTITLEAFVDLFKDVVEDYYEFTTKSPIAKLNFWIGTMLHDLGTILLERHHTGGARLVDNLLTSLEFSPTRKESILSYIQNHGEYKRFYLLEKSPKSLLEFVHGCEREGTLPDMVLEKRWIQSIVDLAATGDGRLTVRFLEITRRKKCISALEEVEADFGKLRRAVWGLEGTVDLYAEQITPAERTEFFDEYFQNMQIVYYHNLTKELSAQTLLNFHYICAQIAQMINFSITTVRLTSDRPEHLKRLEQMLGTYDVKDFRAAVARIKASAQGLPAEEQAMRLLSELRSRFGLIIELKGADTISFNTRFSYEIEQRELENQGRGFEA